jgi:hypothetical protein
MKAEVLKPRPRSPQLVERHRMRDASSSCATVGLMLLAGVTLGEILAMLRC